MDETKNVRARLDAFVAAWNRNDWEEMASLWSSDGDLINPFGRKAAGHAAVRAMFRIEHSNPEEAGVTTLPITGDMPDPATVSMMRNTRYTIVRHSIRFLKEDVAVVDWDAQIFGIKTLAGALTPPFDHHMTLIMTRQDDAWLMLAGRPHAYASPPGG